MTRSARQGVIGLPQAGVFVNHDGMNDPVRASDGPLAVEVAEGKSYFWCSCGRSKTQPLCDGAHAGTGFTPVKYEAKRAGKVHFCGCKVTKNSPMCDGSHSE